MPEPGERLTHLLVLDQVQDREFTRQGRGDLKVRDVERRAHGEMIQGEMAAAVVAQDRARESIEELKALGVIVTIEGSPGFPLRLDSLEQFSTHRAGPRPKWLLLSVSSETENSPEQALVWISDEYREAFLRLIEDYLTKDTKGGKPPNRALIANMGQIRPTVLRDPLAILRRTADDRSPLVGGLAASRPQCR